MRRLLSFHIISQIGYLVMGLALFTVSSMAGLIYFLVHVALAKSTLFLVAGSVKQLTGSFELARTGGLWVLKPGLAVLFGIAAMSLAGIPPFSGFLAKLALIEAGLEVDHVLIVLIALGVSLLTLYSMLKIWNAAFWKPLPTGPTHVAEETAAVVDTEAGRGARAWRWRWWHPSWCWWPARWPWRWPPGRSSSWSMRRPCSCMEPAGYIQAVLGGAP